MKIQSEKRKPIKNYEGLYEITDTGQVYSLDRHVKQTTGKVVFYPGKRLKPYVQKSNKTSYERVTLSKAGITTRYFVHRLTAKAFIANPRNKPTVNHIDNNGQNNHHSNLEWVTHSENMLHAQRQGRLYKTQSKAGKIAGARHRERQEKTIQAMIGTTINNWKIIKRVPNKRSKAYLGTVCMLCDKEYEVNLSQITTGTSKQCRSCGFKLAANAVSDAMIGKTYGSLKAVSWFRLRGTSTYHVMRTTCTCGTVVDVKRNKLLTGKITSCKDCKG